MMKSISNIILFIVYLVIVVTGIYSLMWLIRENKIENFIIGEYIEDTPVNQISDFEYTFTSLLFTNTGVENEYMSVATTGKVSGFDKNKTYTTTVNGSLSNRVPGDYEFVNSIHTKKFYDVNNNLLLSDDLQVSVNFYENGTEFKILTRGGEQAVSYWQKFIANEGLTIKIVECDYSAKIEADNLPEYTLNLYLEETLIKKISINALRQFELPTRYETYHITDWVDINQTSYTKDTLPIKNMNLYAVVAPQLLLGFDNNNVDNDSIVSSSQQVFYTTKKITIQDENEELMFTKIFDEKRLLSSSVILEYSDKRFVIDFSNPQVFNSSSDDGNRGFSAVQNYDLKINVEVNFRYNNIDKTYYSYFVISLTTDFAETPDGIELSNIISSDGTNDYMSLSLKLCLNLES